MDTDLVKRAQGGDEAAFRELTAVVLPRCFRVAFGILRDTQLAEEATQHALIAMWRELPRLRDRERFEAWSYRLLVNACHSEGRRLRRAQPLASLAAEPAAPEALDAVLDRDQLERGFGRLPMEQRAVIVLHLYLGLGISDTAIALDVPAGTVRSRLYHGLRGMRAALAADDRTWPGPATQEGVTR